MGFFYTLYLSDAQHIFNEMSTMLNVQRWDIPTDVHSYFIVEYKSWLFCSASANETAEKGMLVAVEFIPL